MRPGNYRYMQLRFGCRLALQCGTPDVPWEFDHFMWNSGVPGLDWNGAIMHGILWAKTDGTVGNAPVDQSQFECQSTPSSTCASPLSTRLSAALSGVSVQTSNRTMKITQCAFQRDEFHDFACSLMIQTDRIPAPNMPRFCYSHQNPQRAEFT